MGWRFLKDRAARAGESTSRGEAARRALWPHRRGKGKSGKARARAKSHDFVIASEATPASARRKTLCAADRFGRRARRQPTFKETVSFQRGHRP
jgi:hypothetical protein